MQDTDESGEPIYLALDLGSNSFHLVLATFREGKMVRLDRRKDTVRLASGLDSEGRISDEVMERALNSLRGFSSLVVDLPASHVRAVGTNTLRVAKNSTRFLREAEAALGHHIDIISGIEEARLIYLGVSKDLATCEGQKRLVVDIGGGSTEVVLGDTRPLYLESLYMGCVSYSRRFFPDGELSQGAYIKALRAARRELVGLSGKLGYIMPDEVVGSSGTIRAIGSILSASGQQLITLDGLVGLREAILAFSNTADIVLPGLSADRSPVIAGGLAILEALFRELNIDHMQVSEYAIREGIIYDLAGRFRHRDKRQETLEGMMKNYQVDAKQAQRVGTVATQLWQQIGEPGEGDGEILRWAANLHEIGLALSHAGYQKHGAYILQHADMPGFSRQEQQLLGFLVLNHRRKFRRIESNYGFEPDWGMVLCLRLACIFARPRRDNLPESLQLIAAGHKRFSLEVDEAWLEENPLVKDDLKTEMKYWKKLDCKFKLKRQKP